MLPSDDRNAAVKAAELFTPFPQVSQFHDADRLVGRAVAASLGARGRTAWDMYLFYGPDAEWTTQAPLPVDWIHQLGDERWADPEKFRWGDALTQSLRTLAKQYVHEGN